MNQIEIWFGILVRKVIRRDDFGSLADLRQPSADRPGNVGIPSSHGTNEPLSTTATFREMINDDRVFARVVGRDPTEFG
jgi:hypothetical protein